MVSDTGAVFTTLSLLTHQVAAENPPDAGNRSARRPQPSPQQGVEAQTCAAKLLKVKSIIAAAESVPVRG